MNLLHRIKKIEKKLTYGQVHWVTFSIEEYSDLQIEKEKKRLLNEYLANGNPEPNYCIFINELAT